MYNVLIRNAESFLQKIPTGLMMNLLSSLTKIDLPKGSGDHLKSPLAPRVKEAYRARQEMIPPVGGRQIVQM